MTNNKKNQFNDRPVSYEAGLCYKVVNNMFKKLYSRFIDKIVEGVKKELSEEMYNDAKKLTSAFQRDK